MALVDLKLDKKERAEEASEQAYEPDYPYGTCLHLDTDELQKLGVDKLPTVGDTYEIRAIAKVTRVSSSASEGSDAQSGMDLQITSMELDAESLAEKQDDAVGEDAEAAESASVGGRAKTVMSSTYRSR